MDEELKNKIISAVATAFLLGVAVTICVSFGYMPPDPPIPEEGVEVAMGFEDEQGLGNSMPQAAAPDNSRPAASENYATQNTEPSVSMPSDSKGTKTHPEAKPEQKPEQKEPEINKNALFTGKKSSTSGGQGQGNTQGNGQMGSPNGTPGAGNFSGNGGGGSWSLAGRSSVRLSSPVYVSEREGRIVVKIWVDQQGVVTKVDAPAQGSTLTETALVEQCKQAAKASRFNRDEKAAIMQTGTITYVFRKK